MFSKFLFKIGPIVFLLITAGFYFGNVRATNAQLPVEAGLGETCDSETPCDPRFYCPAGVCVQCEGKPQCDELLNQSCINDVCTNYGGNSAGDLCAKDDNCKSGLKCGERKVCEEVGGWAKAFNHSCSSANPCGGGGLICSSTGRCVECETMGDCLEEKPTGADFSACDRGVCVLAGGNPQGAWCVKDAHCASGKCGDNNLCQAAVAGPAGGRTGGEDNWMGIDLTIQDVEDIINGLACWLTRIATAIMVIFLILAGFRFMNARGDPTKWTAAKKNFQHVLIGILVIMAVYVTIATVANAVGRTDFSLIPLVC